MKIMSKEKALSFVNDQAGVEIRTILKPFSPIVEKYFSIKLRARESNEGKFVSKEVICKINRNGFGGESAFFTISPGFLAINHILKWFIAPFALYHEMGHYFNYPKEVWPELLSSREDHPDLCKKVLRYNEIRADLYSTEVMYELGMKYIVTRVIMYFVASRIFESGLLRAIRHWVHQALNDDDDDEHPHDFARAWYCYNHLKILRKNNIKKPQ